MELFEYNIEVTTGNLLHAGTFDNLYVTLIGTQSQTASIELTNSGFDLLMGRTQSYTVTTFFAIGSLLMLQLEKNSTFQSPENEWYCSKIVVTTPDSGTMNFPCLRWVSKGEIVVLRGGRATKVFEDEHPQLLEHRRTELLAKQTLYQWGVLAEGTCHILNLTNSEALPADMMFLLPKSIEFQFVKLARDKQLMLEGLKDSEEQWESFESMKVLFNIYDTPRSKYVQEHWREDEFFGDQFLNGANPNMIQRCSELPANFPVTEEMVKPSLPNGSSLATEMAKGNVFIVDYKRMKDLPTAVTGGKPAPLAAALCLLLLTPEQKLIPIAIQLSQTPGENVPIFLPSDSEYDWLLAKVFVRNADFLHQELVDHLQNTHYLSEVFTLATLRNLPSIHPLNKLVVPHQRHTLYINIIARSYLVGPGSVLDDSALQTDGSNELIRRALSETTYSSLCLPENIEARGLWSIPNFHFRDDAIRYWDIIKRFVKAIVEYYYPSDREVTMDTELQAWIHDIFTHAFLSRASSGIPQRFQTVEEVTKFFTMVIFRSSVEHSLVNNAQAWPPNGPAILRKEPPSTKGQANLQTFFETLPAKGVSSSMVTLGLILSKKYDGFLPLGTFPDERFDESVPKQIMQDFEARLSSLRQAITKRNSELHLGYDYLNPADIENSITI